MTRAFLFRFIEECPKSTSILGMRTKLLTYWLLHCDHDLLTGYQNPIFWNMLVCTPDTWIQNRGRLLGPYLDSSLIRDISDMCSPNRAALLARVNLDHFDLGELRSIYEWLGPKVLGDREMEQYLTGRGLDDNEISDFISSY